MVSAGLRSHLWARLGEGLLPACCRRWRYSFPCGYRTNGPVFLLAGDQGHSKLLEATKSPSPWGSLLAAHGSKASRTMSLRVA